MEKLLIHLISYQLKTHRLILTTSTDATGGLGIFLVPIIGFSGGYLLLNLSLKCSKASSSRISPC